MAGIQKYIDNIQSLEEYLLKILGVKKICVFSYALTKVYREGESSHMKVITQCKFHE